MNIKHKLNTLTINLNSKTMKKTISILILALTVSFTTNAQSWWNSKKIKGNGKVVTETRNTDDYDGIAVGGSFDVVLIKGTEGKITIEGEENLLEYIITEVERNTLKIKYKKNTNIRTTKKLVVTVPVKEIDQVSLGGSGTISSTSKLNATNFKINLGGSGRIELDLDATDVSASIGGSGDIKLSGKTNEFRCSIAGSGSIKAYELKANELSANIAGSGSIRTTVTTKISAKVVGSGSVYYKGKPKYIDSKSVGSGDVVNKN